MPDKDKLITELKAENERLKEENFNFEEIVKLCRCEQYEQTLQEIKAIAETCSSEIECEECPFTDDCKTDSQALGVCRMILKLITKAEEE